MTDLNKTVVRKTRATAFERGHRNIVVILDPAGLIGFRLAKQRRTVYLTIEECFDRARKKQAAKDEQERKAKRKVKR